MTTISPTTELLKCDYNQEKLIISDTVSVEFSDSSLRELVDDFCNHAAEITGLPSNYSMTDNPIVILDMEKSPLLDDFPATATPEKRYALEIYYNHIYLSSESAEGIKAGLTTLLQIFENAENNEQGELEISGRVILDAPRSLH